MSTRSRLSTLLLLTSIAVFAAVGGYWLVQVKDSGQPIANQALLRDGPLLRLPEPKSIADFEMYDHEGDTFSRSSLEGAWTLVFFGFSACPHICPDTLFQLTNVVEKLEGELPPERLPQVLFISVDPERDTAEALGQYRARFGNAIEAISGTDEQLRGLALQFGAHYGVPVHEAGAWYNVEHSISVHLLNPEAQWVGLLSAPHDAEAMAEALERFIR